MPKRKVARKEIDGVKHRICIYCGIWTPEREKRVCCKVCQTDLSWRFKNGLSKPAPTFSPYEEYNYRSNIEAELKGELPVTNLYDGCSKEQIKAMQTGDVELLRRSG